MFHSVNIPAISFSPHGPSNFLHKLLNRLIEKLFSGTLVTIFHQPLKCTRCWYESNRHPKKLPVSIWHRESSFQSIFWFKENKDICQSQIECEKTLIPNINNIWQIIWISISISVQFSVINNQLPPIYSLRIINFWYENRSIFF